MEELLDKLLEYFIARGEEISSEEYKEANSFRPAAFIKGAKSENYLTVVRLRTLKEELNE